MQVRAPESLCIQQYGCVARVVERGGGLFMRSGEHLHEQKLRSTYVVVWNAVHGLQVRDLVHLHATHTNHSRTMITVAVGNVCLVLQELLLRVY